MHCTRTKTVYGFLFLLSPFVSFFFAQNISLNLFKGSLKFRIMIDGNKDNCKVQEKKITCLAYFLNYLLLSCFFFFLIITSKGIVLKHHKMTEENKVKYSVLERFLCFA